MKDNEVPECYVYTDNHKNHKAECIGKIIREYKNGIKTKQDNGFFRCPFPGCNRSAAPPTTTSALTRHFGNAHANSQTQRYTARARSTIPNPPLLKFVESYVFASSPAVFCADGSSSTHEPGWFMEPTLASSSHANTTTPPVRSRSTPSKDNMAWLSPPPPFSPITSGRNIQRISPSRSSRAYTLTPPARSTSRPSKDSIAQLSPSPPPPSVSALSRHARHISHSPATTSPLSEHSHKLDVSSSPPPDSVPVLDHATDPVVLCGQPSLLHVHATSPSLVPADVPVQKKSMEPPVLEETAILTRTGMVIFMQHIFICKTCLKLLLGCEVAGHWSDTH
ncbi:hypothetical protein K439DRAFT_1622322 [Ramaria rubella]|nr:hypothetical protein K439DRAFT_1622322 [Ramaria rubella]